MPRKISMVPVRLRNVGGNSTVTIPAAVIREMNWESGQFMNVLYDEERNEVVFKPMLKDSLITED